MNTLFIICGHSFAGKSTLGQALVDRFGFAEVDVDITKQQVYGAGITDEQLTQSDWNRIYAETDAQIEHLLLTGQNVVDASRNFAKAERQHIREIVARLNRDIVTIYVDTPEAIVRQRLRENRLNPARVDWSDTQFDELIRAMQPPGDDETPLIFPYEDDIQTWMTNHILPILSPR